jgi:DNA-binding response OmpR family regulator
MSAVTKTLVSKLGQVSVQPDAQLLFDQLLSRIPSLDLKEIHRLSQFLPVIVLIPRSSANDRIVPGKISASKVSSERSDRTKLVRIVKNISAESESIFVFGDVTVNFPAMEVVRKGEVVVLTSLEFKTLRYLIQHAGCLISRDELLKEVWGYQNYPRTRTVDNQILKLRQKLERDPSRPVHFRTVHGAGYKFLPKHRSV